jgi:hypothetical protein
VHVRIEEARDDGAPAEIDRAHRRTRRASLTDVDNAPVLDRERASNLSTSIDELAVGQKKISVGGGGLRSLESVANDNDAAETRSGARHCPLQKITS